MSEDNKTRIYQFLVLLLVAIIIATSYKACTTIVSREKEQIQLDLPYRIVFYDHAGKTIRTIDSNLSDCLDYMIKTRKGGLLVSDSAGQYIHWPANYVGLITIKPTKESTNE